MSSWIVWLRIKAHATRNHTKSHEPTRTSADLGRSRVRTEPALAQAAIRTLEELAKVRALRSYHLLPAVLGELWKQVGDFNRAARAYRKALKCDCTAPERRFLESQLQMVATEHKRLPAAS